MDFGPKLSVWILAVIICVILPSSTLGSDDENSQPYFVTRNQTIEVLPGDSLFLPCLVKRKGSLAVMWYKDTQALYVNDMQLHADTRYSIVTRPGYNVTIASAIPEDEGKYYCKINSSPALSQLVHVIVNIPPVITRNTPELIHAKVGQNVTLNCSATGKPHPVITWTKQNGKLPKGEESFQGNILLFTDMDGRYNGGYLCTASNGEGNDSSAAVTLDIKFGAKIISKPVDKIHTGLKRSVKLICAYEGNPKAEAKWFNEEGEITGDENDNLFIDVKTQQNEDMSFLRINSVGLEDTGEYYCAVNNTLGKDRATYNVTGLPKIPAIQSSSHAHYADMYSAQWNVNSAEKPLEYTVKFRMSAVENVTEASDWISLNVPAKHSKAVSVHNPDHYSHTYIMRNLSPSTSYELQIQAKNSFGWGGFSDSFFFDTREEGYIPPTTTSTTTSTTITNPTTPKLVTASSNSVDYNIDSKPVDKSKNSKIKVSSGPLSSAEFSSLGLWTGISCLILSLYHS